MKINKKKYNIWISSFMISLILFASLVIGSEKYLKLIYFILVFVGMYCAYISFKNLNNSLKALISIPFLWITLFAIEMFIYGYFGVHSEAYSLSFHLLNIVYLLMILIILYHQKRNLLDVITKASLLEIIYISIFIIKNEYLELLQLIFYGGGKRLGYTAVGNENTTAISYIFLLIPIAYMILIEKKKKYIPIAIIGIFFMSITGSKKGIICMIIIFLVSIIGYSKNRKKYLMNIFKAFLTVVVVLFICYTIPIFKSLIWERFSSMITTFNNYNAYGQSSTELRLNFIITAFTKAWDRPILGHGWSSFAYMYGYSSLYQTNLYTHCNYAELLFSFGFIGLFMYYWFPIRTIICTIRQRNLKVKILCTMYIVILLFIDIGTVTSYSSILGFLGFLIVYLLLKSNSISEKVKKF